MRQTDQFQITFCFFKKKFMRGKNKWSNFQFQCILVDLALDIQKYQTVQNFFSILTFSKKVWDWFLRHILCTIFQVKYFSCYILLTDQISLSDCLYFFIFSVSLDICFQVDDLIAFQNNLRITFSSCFPTWATNSDHLNI